MARLFSLFLFCFTAAIDAAPHPYLNQHEEGWYWHNEAPEVTKKAVKHAPQAPMASQAADPDKTWKLIGKIVDRARAKAILNPTRANVAYARRLQRLIVAQSNLFSEKWMLDLLLHPEADESLVNPSNSVARDLYNQHNSLLKEQALAAISNTAGLLYFYQGGEPFSERMAEVVSEFAYHYNINIMPIAMTDKVSPLFPTSITDSGQASEMGVKHIPAVFALNPVTKQIMPVAYGLISQSELKDNILLATNEFQTRAYRAED